jgi:hypothetical protein
LLEHGGHHFGGREKRKSVSGGGSFIFGFVDAHEQIPREARAYEEFIQP